MLWAWLNLVVLLLLLFYIIKLWIRYDRERQEELVRNYKHGWPYRFALWKDFKAIVIDGIKATKRGDPPRSIPLATIPYPKWVVERAEREGPCTCYLCQAMKTLDEIAKNR